MIGRRIAYLVALACLTLLFCFYREWMAWVVLLAALLLPVFSLLVSLPAMLTLKTKLECPEKAKMGTPVRTQLQLDCRLTKRDTDRYRAVPNGVTSTDNLGAHWVQALPALPAPPVKYKLRLCNVLTDTRYVGLPGERIPTDHCGLVRLEGCKLYVYDYLGLWRRTVKQAPHLLYVFPRELPMELPSKASGKRLLRWKPKPGGGFGENHDLRLYRPGDELHHIHWKMSAKTGKLIYREPLEPVSREPVVSLTLSGKPEELDRKLGRLLWVVGRLLEQKESVQVRCLMKTGTRFFRIENEQALEEMMKCLLCSPLTEGDSVPELGLGYLHCHIGGEPDER